MSLGAKIAVSAMRGIKKTSLIKGPSAKGLSVHL